MKKSQAEEMEVDLPSPEKVKMLVKKSCKKEIGPLKKTINQLQQQLNLCARKTGEISGVHRSPVLRNTKNKHHQKAQITSKKTKEIEKVGEKGQERYKHERAA